MKTTTFLSVLFAIYLSSCTTVYYTQSYEDANYLTQDEFVDYDDYATDDTEYEDNEVVSDTTEDGTIVNNYYGDYYEDGSQYDFYYSSRIRRFHRPYYNYGYYGNYYTNSYWYSGNPYHFGTSIYYGWGSPYYDSWGYYDPFYYSYYSYYTPYYQCSNTINYN